MSAARIISEWKDYDEELKQFIERYEKGTLDTSTAKGAEPTRPKLDQGELDIPRKSYLLGIFTEDLYEMPLVNDNNSCQVQTLETSSCKPDSKQ